jgi:predicted metal-dependent peptidase
MKTLTTVQRLLTKAKLRLRGWVPYLTHVFAMMRTVETQEVPTMAVDQANRLYCNPDFMERLTPMEVAYALLHEVMHVVLSHCKRFKAVCPSFTERERYAWNLAGDLVIQQLLARHHGLSEPKGIIRIDGCIPNTQTKFLSIPGLVHGMTVEQYYGLLLPHSPEQPEEQGSSGEDNPLDPVNAGSNSDGVPRDYEKPMSAVEHAMVDHCLREAEKKIEQLESSLPGSVAGEIIASLKTRLHPQPDPFDQLRSAVSKSVASPLGTEEYTYRRLNRRQQQDTPRRRGYVRLAPECSIIIDTSGSMEGAETRALTVIAQGLRRVQQPRVVAFDYVCQSAKRISSLEQFQFKGYGGTDMTKAIVEEDETHRPDAIVLVTDGETDWPTKPTRARLIVALVRRSTYSTPPTWAKVIDLTKEVPTHAG